MERAELLWKISGIPADLIALRLDVAWPYQTTTQVSYEYDGNIHEPDEMGS